MEDRDTMSIVDLVKLKRSRSIKEKTELQLLVEAQKQDERVKILKRKLKRRQEKRVSTNNLEIDKEIKGENNLEENVVNFDSGLETRLAAPPESMDLIPPTQYPRANSRKRVSRWTLDMTQKIPDFSAVKQSKICLSKDALSLVTHLPPSEFSLPKSFTKIKARKVNDMNKVKDESIISENINNKSNGNEIVPKKKRLDAIGTSTTFEEKKLGDVLKGDDNLLLRETQLLDLINASTFDDNQNKVIMEPVDSVSDAKPTQVLVQSFDNRLIICSLQGLSLKVKFVKKDEDDIEVGPFNVKRNFENPFLMVSADKISIKEFVVQENVVKEFSFSLIGDDDGNFDDCVLSSQSQVFIKETETIKSLVTLKLSDDKAAVFHNTNEGSFGSIVNYHDNCMEVKYLGSIPETVDKLLLLHGSRSTFLSISKAAIYFWNHAAGRCIRIVNINFNCIPSLFASMVSDNRVLFLHRVAGEIFLSLLSSDGCVEIKKYQFIDCDYIKTEMIKILKFNKESVLFESGKQFFQLYFSEDSVRMIEFDDIKNVI